MRKLNIIGDTHTQLPREARRDVSRVRPAVRTQASRVSKHIVRGDGAQQLRTLAPLAVPSS